MPLKYVLIRVLGPALITGLIKLWSKEHPVCEAVGDSIGEWVASKIDDEQVARGGERLLLELGDEIAASLDVVFAREGASLEPGERTAIQVAVAQALHSADLSTEALVDGNLDADWVTARLRLGADGVARDFSAAGTAFFDRVLAECASRLIDVSDRLPAFQPRVLGALLKRGGAVATAVQEVIERLSRIEAMVAELPRGSTDADFERQWRTALVRTLDRVELFGASTGTRTYPLTSSYISMDWEDCQGHSNPSLAGGHLYVRGDAGCGKTTLLHYIAVRLAKGLAVEELGYAHDRVPFFLRLRAYPDGSFPAPEHLPGASVPMLQGMMPAGWAHRKLRNAVLLVDGIDEIAPEHRTALVRWLRSLLNTFPTLIVVASARPLSEEIPELGLLGVREIRLQALSPRQIQTFITRWHAAVADEVAEEERGRLERAMAGTTAALRARPSLARLASSPLLCAMLCAVGRDRDGHLPDDRIQLYEDCCELLLDRRDRERDIRVDEWAKLGFRSKRLLLAELAWWMVRNGKTEATVDEVDAQVKKASASLTEDVAVLAPSRLRAMLIERSGLVRYPVPGRVDFIHKTFLEFLAAYSALENGDASQVSLRAAEDGWREVCVLAAAQARPEERRKIVRRLLDDATRWQRNRHLRVLIALACLQASPEMPLDLKQEADDALRRLGLPMRNSTTAAWIAAGDLAIPHLRAGLLAERTSEHEWEGCVAALAGMASDAALETLREAKGSATTFERVQRLADAWRAFSDGEAYARLVLHGLPLVHVSFRLRPELRLLEGVTDAYGSLRDFGHGTVPMTLQNLSLYVGHPDDLDCLGRLVDLPHLRSLFFSSVTSEAVRKLAECIPPTLVSVHLYAQADEAPVLDIAPLAPFENVSVTVVWFNGMGYVMVPDEMRTRFSESEHKPSKPARQRR